MARDEFNEGMNNDNDKREKIKQFFTMAILVGSFIAGMCFVVVNYCPPVNKVFSPQAYYGGKYSVEISNPRDIYNNMISAKNSSVTASKCVTEVTYLALDASEVFKAGGNGDLAWPVKGASSGTYEDATVGEAYNKTAQGAEIEADAAVNGYKHWYLWQTEGTNEIVSPWANVTFVNANVDDHGQIIKVMATGGANGNGEVRWLEFRNVKNWFCHMSSATHTESHTTRIGKSPDQGAPSSLGELGQGYAILGTATTETYMVGMSQVPGGVEEEIHPYYVFHPEESLP